MNPKDNLTLAKNYYREMVLKNVDVMAAYLHPDIILISPFANLSGKDTVVNAAKHHMNILEDMILTAEFSHNDQVMLAYEMILKEPIGKLRSASLISFTDNLISKIELFYDTRPFFQKK